MWARYRIATLEGEYDVNRAEIRRLGKAFGLVTRETSLIVLDRVEDYARYEIMPPAELMAAYQNLRKHAVARDGADRQAQVERIVKLFEAKQALVEPRLSERTAADAGRLQGRVAAPRSPPRSARLAERDALRAEPARRRRAAPAAAAPRVNAPLEQQNANKLVAAEGRARRASAKEDAGTAVATIQLRKWTPDAPYIARLREAERRGVVSRLPRRAPGYADSTAFFLDAADVFFERGSPTSAYASCPTWPRWTSRTVTCCASSACA